MPCKPGGLGPSEGISSRGRTVNSGLEYMAKVQGKLTGGSLNNSLVM